jgi:predicted ATPase/DNA-binding CsgD family transcriptional regulator
LSKAVGNLPVHLSDFIGRDREISEIRKLFSSHRLVTLTGAGGSGKTRLSIKVANELLNEFEEGIWFIRFAPLSDSELVPQAVASVLGVSEKKKRPILDTLIGHLKEFQTLLIFDNCEHLIDACAQLAESLLRACPNVKILATSREPMNLPGEVVWTVPPMSLPEPHPWRNPSSGEVALPAYQQSEAVQLFRNRAALVSPDFELTMDNGTWVAEICRRLDGMPLAIELAAARVRALSVQQIAERLDDRFNLLTGGSRTAPARHQTLSATLAWSYALLSEVECRVLQRLSVFSGGATLEAIESVCTQDGVKMDEVLDTLSQLVDKSLVVAGQRSSKTRYSLLETIRQYANEKLIQSGEFDKTKDRHLNYFVEWAETAYAGLTGTDQSDWLNRFEIEHDNLRAALEWCAGNGKDIEAWLRLAGSCGRFWRFRGHLNEGRARLSAALGHDGAQNRTIHRAHALLCAGQLAYYQSDFPVVETLAKEALSIHRELGNEGRQMLARTLDLLGENATETGDHETAPAYFQEALDLFRELDDTRGIGDMHMQIGWGFMRSGELQKARENLEQAQSIMRELGNQRDLGFAYSGLGEAAIREGEYERAKSLLEEGLSLARNIKDRWMIATMFGSLGWVALNQNNLTEMRKVIRESLALRTELGDQGGTAWCLEKLAHAAFIENQYEKSVEIFGAAAALRAPLDSVIDDADLPEYNRLITGLRSILGTEAFDTAWAKGESKPLEEVIELALAESKEILQGEKEKYGGLTKREREVAALIAQGKSNREIAEAMTVRAKTVETYVTRILNKLGFDSRVQIATWAMEKGLK